MFIPIRTDYRLSRRPVINYAIIALNVALFLWSYNWEAGGVNFPQIDHLMLHPDTPRLYQFFSSMFLHANWMHLIGNMVFLWVFGNAINDRFGHAGYLGFYLAGGVLAGLGYMLLAGAAPVLGASGAISAVTGAYLVLLPRARVTLLMFLYFITYFEMSSLYFLLFQFVWNLWMSLTPSLTGRSAGGVAYVAHSSGYVFGIGISAVLLAARVLPRNAFDLLNLIRNRRRRGRYRRMVSRGYDPFNAGGRGRPTPPPPPRRWVDAQSVSAATPDTTEARELDLRKQIAEACARHDLETAAGKYFQLVQVADDAVLSRQNQLDVANQLMATNRYPGAADAYERFVRHYPNYEHIGDIRLMLGVLYGRYLHQYDRAERELEQAVERLHDARKLDMARAELQNARALRGR